MFNDNLKREKKRQNTKLIRTEEEEEECENYKENKKIKKIGIGGG